MKISYKVENPRTTNVSFYCKIVCMKQAQLDALLSLINQFEHPTGYWVVFGDVLVQPEGRCDIVSVF